jgi:hypothetical protein
LLHLLELKPQCIVAGLTALSFVLTFAVAPRFKTAFKEADSWIEIYDRLMEAGGVPSISPKEAAERAKRGKCVPQETKLNAESIWDQSWIAVPGMHRREVLVACQLDRVRSGVCAGLC